MVEGTKHIALCWCYAQHATKMKCTAGLKDHSNWALHTNNSQSTVKGSRLYPHYCISHTYDPMPGVRRCSCFGVIFQEIAVSKLTLRDSLQAPNGTL